MACSAMCRLLPTSACPALRRLSADLSAAGMCSMIKSIEQTLQLPEIESSMSPNDDILVVDDEVAIVAFIAELLAEEGYIIRRAYDGAHALETIAARPPALVLMDHSMPYMTGAEVLAHLRQRGSTLPIIIMSAEEQAELFL